MLNVQKFLRENSIEDLEKDYGIVIKKYDDRITLNYNQISSPRFHPIADECRGLILSLPDYNVLCRPFDRFYNWGEGDTGRNEDISKMTGLSKEDGSCIMVYHDGYKWCVATRKMAFAEGETITGKSYYDLFVDAFGDLQETMDTYSKNITFIFELCTPENRNVKRYENPVVYLLAIRENDTGKYSSYMTIKGVAKILNVKVPVKYTFNNYKEIEQAIKDIDATDSLDEGFVLWNEKTGYRIKIKSPKYVAYHHLRNNGDLSPKNISKLVFDNEYHEYLSIYPEDKKFFNPYIDAYKSLVTTIMDDYEKYKNIEEQKDFALAIKDLVHKSFLFGLRNGLTLTECFDSLSSKARVNYLECFKQEE